MLWMSGRVTEQWFGKSKAKTIDGGGGEVFPSELRERSREGARAGARQAVSECELAGKPFP